MNDEKNGMGRNDSADGERRGERMPPPPPPAAACAKTGRESPCPAIGLNGDYAPMEKRQPTLFQMIDALLKHPWRVAYELTKGRCPATSASLFAITVSCAAVYGLIVGAFSGGSQLWAVPVKMTAGLLLSALICLPSLHIFNAISGGEQTFPQTLGLLLESVALSAILLLGFAPIAWIFAQSTHSAAFMGFLHLLFWSLSAWFGLRLLSRFFSGLNGHGAGSLKIWCAIFVLVVLQMSTTLRPLVGEYRGMGFQGKKFFLAHWVECLNRP